MYLLGWFRRYQSLFIRTVSLLQVFTAYDKQYNFFWKSVPLIFYIKHHWAQLVVHSMVLRPEPIQHLQCIVDIMKFFIFFLIFISMIIFCSDHYYYSAPNLSLYSLSNPFNHLVNKSTPPSLLLNLKAFGNWLLVQVWMRCRVTFQELWRVVRQTGEFHKGNHYF